MDAGIIFNERNREFFNRAARVAFGAALASGNPAAGIAAAARYAALAKFQGDQVRKRSAAALRGRTVPGILIASVTRRCNLNCAGCYSKTLRPDASGELIETKGDCALWNKRG